MVSKEVARERQKQIMKWHATYINNPAIINFLFPFNKFLFLVYYAPDKQVTMFVGKSKKLLSKTFLGVKAEHLRVVNFRIH